MHIIFHTSEYPGKNRVHGGVGTVVRFLAHNFVKKGHSVSVVGINNKHQDEHEIDNGVEIFRLALSKWKFGKFWDHSKRILKQLEIIHQKNPIDIVEGAELAFAFYPQKTPFKKIIRLHGGHHFFSHELGLKPKFWRSFQEKQSFKKADAFIAVSDYVGRKTQEYLGIPFPYEVIYNTIDLPPIKSNIKPEPDTLIFVGTLVEKKGIRQLIQAMPMILEKIPNARLKVFGRDWHFPDGSSFRKLLENGMDKKTADHVYFYGPVPHERVLEELQKTEVAIFPSLAESFGNTWLEAIFSGIPVITSNRGPMSEIIIHNETGLLINPKDPEEIASAAIYLLQNKSLAREMGKKAQQLFLEKFNPDKIIEKNLNFYNHIL